MKRVQLTVIAACAFLLAACGETNLVGGTASCNELRWLEVWSAAPSNAGAFYSDQTLRLLLTPLRSGQVARVRLSNRLSAAPITLSRVHIGQQATGAALLAGSNRPVHFEGLPEVTIAAGDEVLSDPVDIEWRAFDHLAVSIYVAAPGGIATEHLQGHQTSFISVPGSGDLTAQENAAGFPIATTRRPLVTGIETPAAGAQAVLVAVGDSITDGEQRSPRGEELGVDEDTRYPDFLARRLHDPVRGVSYSVLNQGIGGNQVLKDLFGPSLQSRLDADVLSRPGVTDAILLEGINDLGFPPGASADDVISGLENAVARLKSFRGGGRSSLNVLVGTLTPSGGTETLEHGTAETNAKREAINQYIRQSGIGDGVVDFDRALRDPDHPDRLLPLYDSGDHLHPSSAGYERMAAEVDLSTLKGPDCCCP
jgi:lysophospholipase L1-like esterase